MKNRDKISKYLSYILRHKPESIGLKLDSNGWADIDYIIKNSDDFNLTKEIIEDIVKTSPKQRFAIDNGKIRANQGHTIEVDLNLKPKTPPKRLYHGTATRFLDSIMQKGLLSQKRHHVHLTENIDIAKEVGKRYGKVAILIIDSELMSRDGYIFYLSNNGVWLTEHIPAKYISIKS